jgi:hypothetical protein
MKSITSLIALLALVTPAAAAAGETFTFRYTGVFEVSRHPDRRPDAKIDLTLVSAINVP